MAGSAAHGSFLEALRPFQGLDHECCLAKPPILVEPFAGKLSKRFLLQAAKEVAAGGVIQLAVWPSGADGRLHVTLRANCDESSIVNPREIYRRSLRRLGIVIGSRRLNHVVRGRSVTHLAIDAGFFKLH